MFRTITVHYEGIIGKFKAIWMCDSEWDTAYEMCDTVC